MPRLTRRAFERLVEEALATIPRKFRDAIANVAVVVEDEPTPDILDELEIPEGDTLYGLYQGTPLTERQWSQEPRVPDKVSIYQRPIEEDAESEDDIVWMIGETVIHEFGHYFGLSEDEIEAIEERYWRGEEGARLVSRPGPRPTIPASRPARSSATRARRAARPATPSPTRRTPRRARSIARASASASTSSRPPGRPSW